jgi:hypothetical protein
MAIKNIESGNHENLTHLAATLRSLFHMMKKFNIGLQFANQPHDKAYEGTAIPCLLASVGPDDVKVNNVGTLEITKGDVVYRFRASKMPETVTEFIFWAEKELNNLIGKGAQNKRVLVTPDTFEFFSVSNVPKRKPMPTLVAAA